MEWRSFPDPSYKADYSNKLLTARGWRWQMVVLNIAGIGVGLWLMIGVARWELRKATIWIIVYYLVARGAEKLVNKFRPPEKEPKVKCSGCFEEMVKVQGDGPTENAVFHVCHKCRKYVDTGLNTED